MFKFAFLIGIYSYIIFSLGLLGLLYKEVILLVTISYVFLKLKSIRKSEFIQKFRIKTLVNTFFEKPILIRAFILIIALQIFINLIGALGPELGFDALWYHLTIPKIYLENHSIFHISGGLLYYSGMPKLTEMIYLGFLANDTLSKLIHFSFGILSLIALYKLSRNFLPEKYSILAALVFYSNLVVGWQSTTAYVDLARTFFEIMALWAFINWLKEKKNIWLFESAFMLGFAISVKLLSLGSIIIFSVLLSYYFWRFRKINKLTKTLVSFLSIALLVPLPYFVFALLNTGNPIYPIFSQFYSINPNFDFVSPLKLADPISPLYLIFLPFIIFYFRKFSNIEKIIVFYSALSFMVWYLTPQTGGGRFIMPYLPAYSLIMALGISMVYKYNNLRNLSIAIVILISIVSVLYRGGANSKFLPVIFDTQSKDQFLSNNLNFSFGDFYDTDGYFKAHIKKTDKVLLFGFHNLYYINFPFLDSSYVKKGDKFNYIATQNTQLPERFKFFSLIYSNERTGVNLYSLGGQEWIY